MNIVDLVGFTVHWAMPRNGIDESYSRCFVVVGIVLKAFEDSPHLIPEWLEQSITLRMTEGPFFHTFSLAFVVGCFCCFNDLCNSDWSMTKSSSYFDCHSFIARDDGQFPFFFFFNIFKPFLFLFFNFLFR